MTEKSSLTASAAASKLDANVNFIQGPCWAASINAFKAQCIPPAQLVVLITDKYGEVRRIFEQYAVSGGAGKHSTKYPAFFEASVPYTGR
jgi:hypothetical protein